MAVAISEHPMYRYVRGIAAAKTRQLLELFDAHAVSVEWVDAGEDADQPVPGLVFYLTEEAAVSPGLVSPPAVFRVLDDQGDLVEIHTKVVMSPAAHFE